MEKNVLGTALEACCYAPKTGFYRDGFCKTGPEDYGKHVVCVIITEEFLIYSKSKGNDLSTPMPMYQFPGLKAGDKWCLCAARWQQAYEANKAPEVVLEATHKNVLQIVAFESLLEYKHLADV